MSRNRDGFTLIELVLIIIIIGIMASVAVRSLQPTMERARVEATLLEMEELAGAIVGDPNQVQNGIRIDFGYVGDIGGMPPTLDALASNPGGFSTWQGPYIRGSFQENPGDFKYDAWNDAYLFTGGATISSTGGGSPLTRRLADSVSDLTSNSVSGVVSDGLGSPPGDSSSGVDILIYYPDGAGSMTTAATNPSADGIFLFTDMIPIGNHLIRAVHLSTSDTTAVYVSVLPGSTAYCELHFSGAIW